MIPSIPKGLVIAGFLILAGLPAYASTDRDSEPTGDDYRRGAPAQSKPSDAGKPLCPSGQFSDIGGYAPLCSCPSGTALKFLGISNVDKKGRYECVAQQPMPALEQRCPKGRFDASRHTDCLCPPGQIKNVFTSQSGTLKSQSGGRMQASCVNPPPKKCPSDESFKKLDMRYFGCACPAGMKKESYRAGGHTYNKCVTPGQCPIDTMMISFKKSQNDLRCQCPDGTTLTYLGSKFQPNQQNYIYQYTCKPNPESLGSSTNAASARNCGTFWTTRVEDPEVNVNPCPKGCVRGERQLVSTSKVGDKTLYQARYQCYGTVLRVLPDVEPKDRTMR